MESKIIEILKTNKHKVSLNKLLTYFNALDYSLIKNYLDQLEKNNKITISLENNIYLLDQIYKKGTIKLNPKGFGFINDINKINDEDHFIAGVDLNNSIHQDEVVYILKQEEDNRLKAIVIDLIKRNKVYLIGEINRSFDKRFLDFIPNDKSFDSFRFVIVNKNEFKYEEFNIIKAKIISCKERKIFIRLIRIIGNSKKASDRILAIAEEFDIKTSFDKQTLDNAKQINLSTDKLEKEFLKRQNNSLVNKTIVTIDGIDSKDLDDAICVEKLENNNYKLFVAIADVSYFVRYKTALDKEALLRGNSTYLANKVIPMLPNILSDDLCSLNPNTKKLVFVCEMEFDNNANMLNKKVYESVIISKARLNYDEVNNYFKTKTWTHDDKTKKMLDIAYELYKKLEDLKAKKGTISFDVREPKIILDKNLNVIDIKTKTADQAEKLIEQFMVSCNEAVAELIYQKDLPFLYRNHNKPDEDELINWYKSLKTFGINPKLTNKQVLDPIFINHTLTQIKEQIKDETEVELLNISLLRYMDKAKYGLENIGHFGLASDCYTHFTSPIRRYSDLLVHRYLKQYLITKDLEKTSLENNTNYINKVSNIINDTETKSVECEREVIKACMCEYMLNKVNTTYTATISAVLKFGIFIQLDNLVEGLVHISNMNSDLVYDETNRILIKPDNTYYRMGQKVKVKLISVDIKKRTIDFVLIE
ncbi:ribonuclease R [Mycoplasma capricolum]|uniref:ribonuclease R n=1 Tax=Mycoplasma capricolum TaxID=2095 RepID=UPI0022F3A41A|nr:ribonuclease R [Mycoplasma capricolum]WBX36676.1 ribonuclease R [Mycoplasma capricolum subsp. capricolum]